MNERMNKDIILSLLGLLSAVCGASFLASGDSVGQREGHRGRKLENMQNNAYSLMQTRK